MKDKEIHTFTVEGKEGERLDLFLSRRMGDLSRSYAQKLIGEGRVEVNGKACLLKRYKTAEGDRIEIEIPAPSELSVEAEDIPLNIVYEDDDLMVVNKPKGMTVHPAPGNFSGTLVNAVMYHCGGKLSSINGVMRPGIVHRIDKDTSGLIMIAKNNRAHESLSRQLSEHSVTRRYQALVYDNFKEDEGTVDAPIGRDPKDRLKRAVTEVNSRRAVTHYRVLERFGKYTLLELRLETGRTHQIRVHMAYIKHPLVGDQLYGPKKQALPVTGQMLHAKTIGFVHPGSGKYMEFNSELPEYFTDILNRLRERKR